MEIKLMISERIELRDIPKIRLVSREWRNVIDNNIIKIVKNHRGCLIHLLKQMKENPRHHLATSHVFLKIKCLIGHCSECKRYILAFYSGPRDVCCDKPTCTTLVDYTSFGKIMYNYKKCNFHVLSVNFPKVSVNQWKCKSPNCDYIREFSYFCRCCHHRFVKEN